MVHCGSTAPAFIRIKRNLKISRRRNQKPKGTNMIFLGKLKFLQKAVGLDPLGGLGTNIVLSIYFIGFAILHFMVSTFIVLNIRNNVNVALSAVPIFFGLTSAIFIFCNLVVKQENVNSLLSDLLDIVEKSTRIVFSSNIQRF